jgi:predicted CoA-binding protein
LEQAMEKDKNREEYYKQAYEKEKFPSEPYNVYLGRKFYGNVLQHKHNQSTGLTDKQFKEIMYKNEHYREIAHKYGEKPLHIVLDVKNYLESAAIAITTRNIDLAIGHFAKNKLEEKLAFKVMEELLNEGFNIMYNPNRYKPLKTESPVYRSLAEDILSAYYKVDVPRQQAKQKEIARINELNRNIKQK